MIPTTEADLDKMIAEKQANLPSTTISKQIVIYLVSFFLPPFGLGWGFKYIKFHDEKVKRVGLIAILLTIVSIILTIWITMSFFNSYSQTINSINRGMDIGY